MTEQEPAAAERAFSSEEDIKLVRACLQGNEVAWSALLSKYQNLIFSIPIKYGCSQEEASDIFQSVCLDVLNELSSLREPKALAGWLARITHNKCCHYFKDKQRYGVAHASHSDPSVPDAEFPENILRDLQQEQILRSALRSLSKRCQQLVEMLFFQTPPRPYQEVADSLALAKGSIGFIRARCLARLRRSLEELGFA